MQNGNNGAPAGITAVVLAGGKSRRMGRDKALMPWADTSLLGHVLQTVAAEFDTVLLSARDAEMYTEFGVPVLPDPVPNAGPLAGIVAGLFAMTTPWLFVTACDMPFPDPAVWRSLAVHTAADADAVLPSTRKGLEPLCAFYHQRCLPGFRARLESGQSAIHQAVLDVRLVTVDATAWEDDTRGPFTNINTLEEFAAVQDGG